MYGIYSKDIHIDIDGLSCIQILKITICIISNRDLCLNHIYSVRTSTFY